LKPTIETVDPGDPFERYWIGLGKEVQAATREFWAKRGLPEPKASWHIIYTPPWEMLEGIGEFKDFDGMKPNRLPLETFE
jgi:hypothetical protein